MADVTVTRDEVGPCGDVRQTVRGRWPKSSDEQARPMDS